MLRCRTVHHKRVCPFGPVVIRTQTVRINSDGIVGIRATCRRRRRCVGAIIVEGHVQYGRADLRIPAHGARVVRVALGRKGRRYLNQHGCDRRVLAFVPLNESGRESFPFSHRLTLCTHRRKGRRREDDED